MVIATLTAAMLASKPKKLRGKPGNSSCKNYRIQSKSNIFNQLLMYSSWKMLNNIICINHLYQYLFGEFSSYFPHLTLRMTSLRNNSSVTC